MSPASQGSLEVERYIGSCLISARSHNNSSKNSSGPANNNHHHPNHQHGNYKNKKVDGGGGGRGGGGRLQSRPLLGCPHHQGYAGPGGQMVAMCDCARYGSPGQQQQHGHAPGGSWAGMPLISMASHTRRNRKPAVNGPPRNNNNRPSPPPPPMNVDGGDPNNLRSPLSRLAIHTQGAPLILAGHYNARKNNNNNNNSVHRGGLGRQFKGDSPLQQQQQQPRRCNGGDVPRDLQGGGGGNNNNNGTPNSDCLSVASDESSGHSENSLPRIIKPRKRRKKDRKPPASPTTGAGDAEPGAEVSGIVTLKPYVPLCRELYDNNHRGGGRRREEAEVRWVGEQRPDGGGERATPCSNEDAQDRNLRPSGVDDNDAPPLNTLFPYPCAPSTCQCRYCDPVGQIWDVDQHCYSPFLTPPSIDLSYPLLFTPPPEVKSFDLFNKDFKDSTSHVTDADHKEVVRRSWSEPSATSYADNGHDSDVRRTLNDFGVIGGGRTCDGGGVRRGASRHMSTSSETSSSSSSTSSSSSSLSSPALQSLEVSTEIVTSLNGHRDLEIKFFSTSPPSVLADVFDFSGCDSATTTSTTDKWRCANGGARQELWCGSRLDATVFPGDLNHNQLKGVWGDGDQGAEGVDGDATWGRAWSVESSAGSDCSSKRLSEEVDQLCIQNVEE